LSTTEHVESKMDATGRIDERYKQATKLLIELRLQFEKLDGPEGSSSSSSALSLQETIQFNLNSLSRLLNSLETEHLPSQTSKRREIWRMYECANAMNCAHLISPICNSSRIQQVADEYKDMRSSFGRVLQKKRSREQEEEQRRQLLDGVTRRQVVWCCYCF